MSREQWDQVRDIFEAALGEEPAERDRFVAAACGDDDALLRQVSRLLRAHTQAGNFLEKSPLFVAGIIRRDGPVGRRIGPYLIEGELGQGGMGAVYLASRADEEYRQQVAIKLIWPGIDQDEIVNRFRTERQILADLNHPNIARLLDGGRTDDGWPYLVMEYVEGEPITRFCNRKKLSINERLKLFREVCDAVSHAHGHRVIHRDIKPGNILATEDGAVKLLDFGIAKLLSPDNAPVSVSRSMLDWMTPDYASPEQLRAERVTARSDVYSLGVVLYELLTGQRPYSFKNQPKDQPRYEIARAICEQEPERPSARVRRTGEDASNFSEGNARRRLAGDLDRIVLKALAKEPERRYQSVAELSEDIRRHLAGRPVVARGDSLSYRAGKLMRRHKVMTAVLAGCLIAGLIALAWRAVTAPERRLAGRRANHAAQIEQAAAGLKAKDFDASEQALQRCVPQPGEEDLRGFEWHYLRRLGHRALLTLRHRSPLSGSSFVSGGRIFTGGMDYTYKLWDETTGRELAAWKLAGESPGAITPDPHGQADRLVLVENNNSVKVWDLATGQLLHDLTDPAGGVTTAKLLPDRRTLVTGHQDGGVKLRDAATGRPLFTLRGLRGRIELMGFSADGRRMLTNIANTHIQLWDWPGRRVIATFRESVGSWFRFTPKGGWFWTLVENRKVVLRESAGGGTVGVIEERGGRIENARMLDERRLAVCLSTGEVKIYELPSRRLTAVFQKNSAPVLGVALSPDGRLLVTSNIDGEITVWDVATRRELTAINGHAKETYYLAFSPDGRKLISGSEDGTAKVWDVAAISKPDILSGHGGKVFSVAFSPDGQRLATASSDRTIKLWDVKTGKTLRTFTGHEDQILCVVFSPDGKRIASSGSDGAARVWDVATGRSLATLKHSLQIHSVAFSPDGRWLATAGSDREVRIWDAATGQEVRRLTGHGDEVWTVAFSPDGRKLASGGKDKSVKLWDAATGREIASLSGHAGWVWSVIFSRDSGWLATGSSDRTTKLWDLSTLREVRTFTGHKEEIFEVALSPDGKRLATASKDDSIKIWDTTTGQALLTLSEHEEQVWSVAFSPDGRTLASGSWDGKARLWRTDD